MGIPDQSRYIYLYASSKEQKEMFQRLADAAGVTLSKFLLSKIEESLSEKKPTRFSKELAELKKTLADLREELHQKDRRILQYEALLERQKTLSWLEDSNETLDISYRLVQALKDHGPIHEARLLELLGVEADDTALVLAISYQLELLERHGRIKKNARGWRWTR